MYWTPGDSNSDKKSGNRVCVVSSTRSREQQEANTRDSSHHNTDNENSLPLVLHRISHGSPFRSCCWYQTLGPRRQHWWMACYGTLPHALCLCTHNMSLEWRFLLLPRTNQCSTRQCSDLQSLSLQTGAIPECYGRIGLSSGHVYHVGCISR